MGIDAEMFVRYKGAKPTEDQIKLWSWDLAQAIGAQHFFIDGKEGRTALRLTRVYNDEGDELDARAGREYHQDGEPIIANVGEWFIQVAFWTRYYGIGYERGNWQIIVHTAEWLEQNIGGIVYYGGDSSGVCAEPFGIEERAKLVRHALSSTGRDYFKHFEREPFKTPAPCNLCVKSRGMTRFGWGSNYIAVSCAGCGKSFETRNDGKTWNERKDE